MMFFRHFVRLIRELFGFAREHKAWWLVPLMIFLALIAVVIVAAVIVFGESIRSIFQDAGTKV